MSTRTVQREFVAERFFQYSTFIYIFSFYYFHCSRILAYNFLLHNWRGKTDTHSVVIVLIRCWLEGRRNDAYIASGVDHTWA